MDLHVVTIRLHLLVVGHVVSGAAFSWAISGASNSDLLAVSFAATFFAQCALLAVWGGFSTAPRLSRYVGIGVGMAYLWLAITVPAGFHNTTKDLIGVAVLIAACVLPELAVFRALQLWGPKLIVCRASQISAAHRPFQFSIKHLLLVSLGIAAALTLGRAARAVDPEYYNDWPYLLLVCAVLGACTLHLILAAVWACLAIDKALLRTPLAFAAAVPVGLVPAFYFNAPSTRDVLLCVAAAVGGQAVTMLSLDIVRSAGYRVVRTNITASPTAPQTERIAAHPLD